MNQRCSGYSMLFGWSGLDSKGLGASRTDARLRLLIHFTVF